METTQNPNAVTPPRLIPSISQGFAVVANRIYLILFPLALDLFLWLGPHLSFEKILQDVFTSMKASLAAFSDMAGTVKAFDTIQQGIQQLNFFSMLRSFPIGIPSLINWWNGVKTPLGTSGIIPITSSSTGTLIFIGASILGIILGALYLETLNQVSFKEKTPLTFKVAMWTIFQCLLLCLAMVVAFFIILIPVSLLSDVLLVMAPGLYQVALFVVGIFIIWLLMPLIFAAHGIFVERRNAIQSIMLSIRMVRSYLPGTGLFVLTAIVIYLGLNMLWSKPPMNSWFLLLGIFGHAFIATALLTASFVFYRGGLAWMKERIRRATASPHSTQA